MQLLCRKVAEFGQGSFFPTRSVDFFSGNMGVKCPNFTFSDINFLILA